MIGIDWNSTDVTDGVFLRDISITTAVVGLTGIAASNVTARYWKPGMTAQGTLAMTALASLGAAHVDGGWLQIDATGMPGHYRLDLSDTMVASVAGANPFLQLHLAGTAFEHVPLQRALLQPLSAATIAGDVRFINGTTAVGAGGYFGADIIRAGGTAVGATAGFIDVNQARVGNTAVVATAGYQDVNVARVGNTTVPATAGYQDVNVARAGNTAVAATAGRLNINVSHIGNTTVAATAGVVDANAITLGTSAQSAIRTEVNQSIDTIVNTTARNTPTSAAPPINPALGVKVDWLYERAVSRLITNATSVIQHNGSNVAIATATLAGDTATDTRNRFA